MLRGPGGRGGEGLEAAGVAAVDAALAGDRGEAGEQVLAEPAAVDRGAGGVVVAGAVVGEALEGGVVVVVAQGGVEVRHAAGGQRVGSTGEHGARLSPADHATLLMLLVQRNPDVVQQADPQRNS